jgi:hypothetical protein
MSDRSIGMKVTPRSSIRCIVPETDVPAKKKFASTNLVQDFPEDGVADHQFIVLV